jgi:hypothetical protein
MTTTDIFQKYPDFYDNDDDCKDRKVPIQTNSRYSDFKQIHFTAGDEDQFIKYSNLNNGNLNRLSNICVGLTPSQQELFHRQAVSLENIFKDISFDNRILWEKYNRINATSVMNTFKYMFYKLKKGLFVQIRNNKLKVFLPFSNKNFRNEWGHNIKVDPLLYGRDNNYEDFLLHINNLEGRRLIRNGEDKKRFSRGINAFPNDWYANNCLIRYEYPVKEGDSNVGTLKNMLEELCKDRIIPDVEFFLNRRDFPAIKKNSTEPYNHLFNDDNFPLISHMYEKYAPILSISKTEEFADILIPSYEDWARVSVLDGKYFPSGCSTSHIFNTNWDSKKSIAVFRGGSTGCGVTVETNMRLKVSYLSYLNTLDTDGKPFLDAGITKWNLRPRKIKGNEYLQTIEKDSLGIWASTNASFLSPEQQSNYKYIIHIDGHVSAFRLSLELGMGSVILLQKSSYTTWYKDMLEEYKHYIPINNDLSNLITQIKWCKEHDEECKKIAQSALDFYNTYLQKNGILDYLQKLLINIKEETGVYLYNSITPLELQIKEELTHLQLKINRYHPLNLQKSTELPRELQDDLIGTNETINIYEIPSQKRNFNYLQGIQWVINLLTETNLLTYKLRPNGLVVKNKLSIISRYSLNNYLLIIKSSKDENKTKEDIHDAFVGIFGINNVLKKIPNFCFTFGLKNIDELTGNLSSGVNLQASPLNRVRVKQEGLSSGVNLETNLIIENIEGNTFSNYLLGNTFNFKDYLFILIQIALSLEIAQNTCCFVHYDLTPWNIMIKPCDQSVYDYVINYEKIYRIRTSLMPIIIDYGKSHITYNNIHHGLINMYKSSSIQDIISILLTSVDKILSRNELNDNGVNLMKLCNFISNTGYSSGVFSRIQKLKRFININTKYSVLTKSNKYELEEKRPIDFVKYIIKTFPEYKFDISTTLSYTDINSGNSKQVFDYILANNTEKRIKSFTDIFIKVKQCSIPIPKNLFLCYYSVQTLEYNIALVNHNMKIYLKTIGIQPDIYVLIFKDTIAFITKTYDNIIKIKLRYGLQPTLVNLLLPVSPQEEASLLKLEQSVMILADYTEEDFLVPEKILQKYEIIRTGFATRDVVPPAKAVPSGTILSENLCYKKDIIEHVLIYNGLHKMNDELKIFYIQNFNTLLKINNSIIKNNISNSNTLIKTSKSLYSLNMTYLQEAISPGVNIDCVSEYKVFYNKIINL